MNSNYIFHLTKISQNSGIEKAFLFDVVSKIYIATDSSPVDMQSYELCCDMIDVVIDLSSIYGYVSLCCCYPRFPRITFGDPNNA